MKGINEHFIKIKGVFTLLAILLVVHVVLICVLHNQQKSIFEIGYELRDKYSDYQKERDVLVKRLLVVAENASSNPRDNEKNLKESLGILENLETDFSKWSLKASSSSLLSQSILNEEKRSLANVRNAWSLLRQNKFDKGQGLILLEVGMARTHHKTTSYLTKAMAQEAKSVDSYLVLSLGGFLVMTLPVFFMSYMSLEKTHSLMRKDVLELINLTNFVKQPHIDEFKKKGCRLDEMSVLYKSIEDLVSILKNRHMLSEDDFARTKQSNQELEQVVKRSQDDVSMTNDLLSRKNMELEQILYAASHDLRTPLIGVQGFSQELQYLCEMLMDELKEMGVSVSSSEKLTEILQNDIPNSVRFIIQGSNKMDSMIQGLLRVSRVGLEKISTEAVDMDEMLKQIVDCLSFQAQSANAMILVDVLEPCVCDKEKLEQVFTNLIANAIKYRHKERSCEIRVSSETH